MKRSWSWRRLCGLTATLILLSSPALAITPERKMLNWVNRSRLNHGCGTLQVGWRMQAHAEEHSHLMRRKQRLFHSQRPATWAENVGVIPRGYLWKLFRSYMDSPLHRSNILNCSFTHTGNGVVSGSRFTWHTQVFR